MKRIAITICCAASLAAYASQIVPDANLVNWTPGTYVGVQGGIPTSRTTFTNVVGIDNTGATDVTTVLQSIIDACPANKVVYLPAGTYRIDGFLSFDENRDNITLRGAGPTLTILDCRGNAFGISAGSASDYDWNYPSATIGVSNGVAKGSTTVTISDTTDFVVGRLISFFFEDELDDTRIQAGAYPTIHVSSYRHNRRHMAVVTGKAGSGLSFHPPLLSDYGFTNLSARVAEAQRQTDGVGIEDLWVKMDDSTAQKAIQFEQCVNCWTLNVKITKPVNYGIFWYDSLFLEARKCDMKETQTEGSNHAGLLCNTTGSSLFENNIVYKFFPLLEINFGSSGNVFAYNFCFNSIVSGTYGAAMDGNHGPHNLFNLYEGNITPNFQWDGYYGSCSGDTGFRNWATGLKPDGTDGLFIVNANRFTRGLALAGNIFGVQGNSFSSGPYLFGLPNMGSGDFTGTAQPTAGDFWTDWAAFKAAAPGSGPGPTGFQEKDLDVEPSTTKRNNYDMNAEEIPAGEVYGGTFPDSQFRSGKPYYFPAAMAWPPFNPLSVTPSDYTSTTMSNTFRIPAQQAFFTGSWPVEGGSTITATTLRATTTRIGGQ